jgi:hypothetical protein
MPLASSGGIPSEYGGWPVCKQLLNGYKLCGKNSTLLNRIFWPHSFTRCIYVNSQHDLLQQMSSQRMLGGGAIQVAQLRELRFCVGTVNMADSTVVHKEGSFKSPHGYNLFTQAWLPAGKPRFVCNRSSSCRLS